MSKYWIYFILLILSGTATGQEVIPISRAQLDARSTDNNLQYRVARDEATLARTELLKSRARYLPEVSVSYTFTTTNNPLMAFGSRLNQERITTMDFDPESLNNPQAISNFGTKIEVRQPIFNQDAVYQKKAGEAKAEALEIKSERTAEFVRLNLSKSYLMLQLAYKMKETLEQALITAMAHKKVVDNYYKNGLIQKSEVLFMDVRLREIESQLQTAQSNILNASDYLFYLLNEDSEGKVFKPQDELQMEGSVLSSDLHLNPERKDLLAQRTGLKAYDWMIQSSKAKFLPRLNAFGSYEMYDKNIAAFHAKGYLVGLQLSWDLFDGLKSKSDQEKYRMERLKADTELENYTQQSRLELKKARRQVTDAEAQINFSQEAWEQSKEAHRIRKNRFEQGLEKSADLLTAETLMAQKELEYQQAIFEYNSALEYLNFLSK